MTAKSKENVLLAIGLEGGLVFVALAIAAVIPQFLDLSVWPRLLPTWAAVPSALIRGLLATLPMLLGFVVLYRSRWAPLVRLRKAMVYAVNALLGGATTFELAVISLLAGVGEEALFRGVLQPFVAYWTTPLIGLVVVRVLFGLAHCLTWTYFVIATLIGFFFGWLADLQNEIISPALAHGLYDFIVLVFVLQRQKVKEPEAIAAKI